MNIQAISELNELTSNTISELSSNTINEHTVNYFIETSVPCINNGNVYYKSKKLSLNNLLASITNELTKLQSEITKNTNLIKDVSQKCVQLSGTTADNPIYGPLYISVSGVDGKALEIVQGKIVLNSSNISINDGNITIIDGVLKCKKDIDGCALTAKWC